ncbi:MAG: ABC transporter substrate-binding protein [Dehalococcoidia bacterium]
MSNFRIMVSRHSAFYSPLISTIAGGFLEEEGLEASYGVVPAGQTAADVIAADETDVCQSAVSNSWGFLERGETPPIVHFAQINERDGFFVAAREPDPGFTWDRLAGADVLADHGGQPLAMFKFAVHRMGVDYAAINAIDAGDVDQIDAAFRAGTGTYVHQQGPAPQQLEKDGVGHVVASVGEAIGPVAFSSVCARREFLGTDRARAFMRAYLKSRNWVINTPAEEVASREASFFPGIDQEVLSATIRFYQGLGCWNPSVEITRQAYDTALDVFLHSSLITKRHPYEEVVVAPPHG